MYCGLLLDNAYDLRRDEAEFANDFEIHREKKDVQGTRLLATHTFLPSIFSPRNLAVGPLLAPHCPLVILFSHFLELFNKLLDL